MHKNVCVTPCLFEFTPSCWRAQRQTQLHLMEVCLPFAIRWDRTQSLIDFGSKKEAAMRSPKCFQRMTLDLLQVHQELMRMGLRTWKAANRAAFGLRVQLNENIIVSIHNQINLKHADEDINIKSNRRSTD